MSAKKNIVDEYLDIHDKYVKKFGSNSIILMQVGSFHEAYSIDNRGPLLHKIGDEINCIVTRKNKKCIDKPSVSNPYMMGVPSHSLDRYLNRLIDNNYRIIVIDQTTLPPNPVREVTGIYSRGTYLENNLNLNHILSIYTEKVKDYKTKRDLLNIGFSIIDVSTGKLYIHKCCSGILDINSSMDEMTKMISFFNPKEIIFNGCKKINSDKIFTYCNIDKADIVTSYNDSKYYKINYQNEMFKEVFNIKSRNMPIEYLALENEEAMRNSLSVLLSYVKEHNLYLLSNINEPKHYFKNRHLQFGNDITSQLDLIRDKEKNYYRVNTKICSLFDVINFTSTKMGYRYLYYQMLHPLTNKKKIQERYNLIEQFDIKNVSITDQLKQIKDIEKLYRRICMKIIHPKEMVVFIHSLEHIYSIFVTVKNIFLISDDIIDNLYDIISFSKRYNLNNMESCLLHDFHTNIYKKDNYPSIDDIDSLISDCKVKLENKKLQLLNYIPDSKDNFIKIIKNDKQGYLYEITKKRYDIVQNNKNHIKSDFDFDSLHVEKIKKGTYLRISNKFIKKNGDSIVCYLDKLNCLCKEQYIKDLSNIQLKFDSFIRKSISIIEFVDFINSGYLLYKKRDYVKPKIQSYTNSFVSIKKMRHPIVEQLIDSQYKSHDIDLGKKEKGILLYGLNSSGKSTIMKALGLNIILAQMGYYTAANEMIYEPYENLFCRISSYDNLFKGLSSFHLELNELDTILNRFNKNTLILADEICRGTEHLSAMIIVATLLIVLIEKESSFISATHLHELVKLEDIKLNKKIVAKHIQVECDYKNNTLIYHRKLCNGSGPSEYGLDVATFLMKNKKFIQQAIHFRNKVKPIIHCKSSRYNSNNIMKCCSSCGVIPSSDQKPLETHHILHQKDSDSNGFFKCVKGYHKNKLSNLVNLCTKCHDDIDRKKLIIDGYSDTSSGLKLQITKTIHNNV